MTMLLLLLISALLTIAVVMVILLIYMRWCGVRYISFSVERPQKRQEAQHGT